MQTNSNPLLLEIIQILKKQSVITKEFLSFQEACEYLDLSPSFLYKMTSQRRLPFYVPNGKKIYFRKSDLDSWIMKKRMEAMGNIENP